QASRSGEGHFQRGGHDGQCQRAHIPHLSLAGGAFWRREQADSADGRGAGLLLCQYAADLGGDRVDRGEVQPEGVVGVLLLVVPLLSRRRGGGGPGGNRESAGGMGDVAAGSAVDLLGIPIVPALPRTARSREGTCGD